MDRPCLDRSSFNVWGLGITRWHPLSSSLFLPCPLFYCQHHHQLSTAYFVIEADTGFRLSSVSSLFVIYPLYMLLLCLSMLSSERQVIRLCPLNVVFCRGIVRGVNVAVLLSLCRGHGLWWRSSSRSGSESWSLSLVNQCHYICHVDGVVVVVQARLG